MDFWEALTKQLSEHSYLPVGGQEGHFYWRAENPVLYLFCFMRGKEEQERLAPSFDAFAKSMENRLDEFYCTCLVALSVFIGEETPEGMQTQKQPFYYEDKFYRVDWHFSPETKKLTAGEGQPDRMLGLEKLLLAAAEGEVPEELPLRKTREMKPPVFTAVIFGICAVMLLYMMVSGRKNEIISALGLSTEGILNGEYYRFLTSIFLHGGWVHLLSNGIYLYYFGIRSEQLLGGGRFLVLYLLSGLLGGVFSVFLGHTWLSIGASGAIYGLLGAMLLLTKKRGVRYTGMNYSTILLMALVSIGLGFLETGVDNFAHIGGFLGGILVFGVFLQRTPQRKKVVHK